MGNQWQLGQMESERLLLLLSCDMVAWKLFAVLNITDSYGSNVQLANALPYDPVEHMAMTGDINAIKN